MSSAGHPPGASAVLAGPAPAAISREPSRTSSAFDTAFLTTGEGITELVLVRHGEQDVPVGPQVPIGVMHDPPLSERGRAQAYAVGLRFAAERIDAVYASPLARAFDTGAQIARHHGLDMTVEPDVREVEVFRDVPQDRPIVETLGRRALLGMRQRMQIDRKWDVYSHSEGSAEFRKRTVNAIEGIVATHPGERVVVACHGGVICAYLGWILGQNQDMWFRPGHTSVNVVRALNAVRVVETIGDSNHLRTLEGDLRSW